MKPMKRSVRNGKGTLLFAVVFLDGKWYVEIKNHGLYTLVTLNPDGTLTQTDHEHEVQP